MCFEMEGRVNILRDDGNKPSFSSDNFIKLFLGSMMQIWMIMQIDGPSGKCPDLAGVLMQYCINFCTVKYCCSTANTFDTIHMQY